MTSRIALAVFVALVLAIAVGWMLTPNIPSAPAGAELTVYRTPAGADPDPIAPTAAIIAVMIVGAATIGIIFFRPETPKGPREREALSVAIRLFVECARRGLADLHQEFQVVLGLLQSVDQQIDRLMRIQPGKNTAQFVQHRGLVGVEQ